MGASRSRGLAGVGISLSGLSLAALAFAGLGTRWGLWDFRAGFLVLKGAALAGFAGALLSLLAAPRARGAALALALGGAVVGLAVAWAPWTWYRAAGRVPPIHDITTDWENPPQFAAVLPLRRDASNSAQYGGPELAAQQRRAYPGLGPARLLLPPDVVFREALGVATAMGWQIVAADPVQGRIEATDTTFWFGFKDDIVVRVEASGVGSRVDVRSVSRVGKSDVGTNARRIEAFLARLAEAP